MVANKMNAVNFKANEKSHNQGETSTRCISKVKNGLDPLQL